VLHEQLRKALNKNRIAMTIARPGEQSKNQRKRNLFLLDIIDRR